LYLRTLLRQFEIPDEIVARSPPFLPRVLIASVACAPCPHSPSRGLSPGIQAPTLHEVLRARRVLTASCWRALHTATTVNYNMGERVTDRRGSNRLAGLSEAPKNRQIFRDRDCRSSNVQSECVARSARVAFEGDGIWCCDGHGDTQEALPRPRPEVAALVHHRLRTTFKSVYLERLSFPDHRSPTSLLWQVSLSHCGIIF